MANADLHYMLQEYGTGDEIALALTTYSGVVLETFKNSLVFGKYTLKKYPTSGKAEQFPASALVTGAEHTAGTELAGNNQPEMEERLISADTKQYMAHRYFNEVQEFISHYDSRAMAAREFAYTCAREWDSRIARAICLGAAVAASGSGDDAFLGGKQVTADVAGAVTTAYPKTLQGSKYLQADIEEIALYWDESNVPMDGRVIVLTPYLRDVLLMDKSIVSQDFIEGENRMLRRVVTLIAGCTIEVTNMGYWAKSVATGESAYQGDFSKVVAVGLVNQQSAGQVIYGGGIRPIPIEWVADKQSWLQGAKFFQGCGYLRPECCATISIQ